MADQKPRALNILGDTVVCKLSGRDTGGTHSVFEVTTPPGNGTPPHVHKREDETFYILEGQYEFVTPGRTIRAGPGATVFAPRNVAHNYRNAGSGIGRMLLVASPAGLESFFEDIDREIGPRPPEMPALLAILSRHQIELVSAPQR